MSYSNSMRENPVEFTPSDLGISSQEKTRSLRSMNSRRRSSLMGIAPAITDLSQPYSNNFKTVKLWYIFRRLWFILFVLVVVLMFIIPYVSYDNVESYLLSGGLLSTASCVTVIVSYKSVRPWKRHPSSLIIYRTLSSLLLSIIISVYALNGLMNYNSPEADDSKIIITQSEPRDHSSLCRAMSFLTEFSFFSAEMWILFLTFDLYYSLTNPFTSYKNNVRSYHAMAWTVSVLVSLGLAFQNSCQGVFLENGMCWIKIEEPYSGCFWGYALFWAGAFYSVALFVLLFAYVRLAKGLESTYATRRQCVQDTFGIIFIYIFYLCLLGLTYTIIEHYIPTHRFNRFFKHLFAYQAASRGTLDSFVWFSFHDFKRRHDGPIPTVDRILDYIYYPIVLFNSTSARVLGLSVDNRYDDNYTLLSAQEPLISSSESNKIEFYSPTMSSNRHLESRELLMSNISSSQHEHDDYITDLDLTPQLNHALRKELLYYITLGIKRSLERHAEREEERSKLLSRLSIRLEDGRERSISSSVLDSPQNNTNNKLISKSPQLDRSISLPLDFKSDTPSKPKVPITSSRHFSSSGFSKHQVSDRTSYRYGPYRSINTSLSSHLQRALGVAADFVGISVHSENLTKKNDDVVHPLEDHFYLDDKYIFKDFYPEKFRYIRQLNMIDDSWYMQQLIQPTREMLQHRSSGGSSGSFMFYSNNSEYLVKTVSKDEANVLINILDRYISYISTHSTTLLSQILGLHSVTMYHNMEFIFIVMKNIFPPALVMNEKYDIKGSYIDRNCNISKIYKNGNFATCKYCSEVFMVRNHHGTSLETCHERLMHSSTSPSNASMNGSIPELCCDLPHEASVIMKDNDFTTKIRLRPQDTVNVFQALFEDSNALCAMGITDYSLLIGIHHDTVTSSTQTSPLSQAPASPNRLPPSYPVRSVVAQVSYHFGIIDILQTWTLKKRAEQFYKVQVLRLPLDGLSCLPPQEYKERFQRKLSQIIDTSVASEGL